MNNKMCVENGNYTEYYTKVTKYNNLQIFYITKKLYVIIKM